MSTFAAEFTLFETQKADALARLKNLVKKYNSGLRWEHDLHDIKRLAEMLEIVLNFSEV